MADMRRVLGEWVEPVPSEWSRPRFHWSDLVESKLLKGATPVKLAGAVEKQLAHLGVRVLAVMMLEPNDEERGSDLVPVSIIIARIDMPDDAEERERRRQHWAETVRQALIGALRTWNA